MYYFSLYLCIFKHAEDRTGHGGFAAARLAHKTQDLTLLNTEVHVLDCLIGGLGPKDG